MSDILKNLKKLCEEHEKHLSELKQRISEIENIPKATKAKALVGKCFKYPNTYSTGFGMFGAVSTGRVRRNGFIYKRITDCD
jgi:ribosomal protein L35AE/L33A